MRAGVSGYLRKDAAASDLLAGIRALNDGRRYFAPSAARAANCSARAAPPAKKDLCESLTDRERDVFHLVVECRTNAQIAAVLAISPRTVDNHRAAKNHLIP